MADAPRPPDRPAPPAPQQPPPDASAAARNERNRLAERAKQPHPDWPKVAPPTGKEQVKVLPGKAPDLSKVPGWEHVPGIRAGITSRPDAMPTKPESQARPERPIVLTGSQETERAPAVHPVKQRPPERQPGTPVDGDRIDAAERANASAARILELSKGKAPAVRLTDAVKKQLTKVAEGAEPGRAPEVPSKKGPVEIGEQQAKALGVLEQLAEATAARREAGAKDDQLSIISYVRGGEGKHGTATGFDIAAYGGHKFDENNPAESRAAA